MKHTWIYFAAALLATACAQSPADNTAELCKLKFDSWVSVNRQSSWTQTELGSWIMEMEPGDVANQSIADREKYPFLRIEYTIYKLDGTISSTTSEDKARQIGSYKKQNWYGPQFSDRSKGKIYAGLEELMEMMGVGGHCKAVVPGWLLTSASYSSGEEYLNNLSSDTDALIYEIKIIEAVEDPIAWQTAKIKEALGSSWDQADSLDKGVYYIQDKPSSKPDTTFSSGSKVHINYCCRRLLDNAGVDTNIADSAKVFGTWSSSTSYSATQINWANSASEVTMGSNSNKTITGFALGVLNMRPGEKGRVYMNSDFAYGSSGSGSAIPGYCPIYFEITFLGE